MSDEKKASTQEENDFPLGCELVEDDPRNFPYYKIEEVGAMEVPDFRIDLPKSNQGNKPSCVGHAVGKQKSKQETNERGELIDLSKMFLYSLCKREQNFSGWGTNVPLAMKMSAKYGVPLDSTVPEDTTLPEDVYIRVCDNVSQDVYVEAAEYRSETYWYIYPGDWARIVRTAYNERIPLVTTNMWYKSYNRTEKDGRLPLPSGGAVGGHAFVFSEKETVDGRVRWWFDNSFGKNWGKDGRFYIWEDELEQYGLGTFFIIVDIPHNVADILVKYQGKVIKNANDPRCYFVDKKKIIHIGDEQTFVEGKDFTHPIWGDWNTILTIPEEIKANRKIVISNL